MVLGGLLVSVKNPVFAQRWHLGLSGGAANYQGDLQAKRIDFEQAGPVGGLSLEYELMYKVNLRAQFSFGKIQAYDQFSADKSLAQRNLNFQSELAEFSITGVYHLFSINERRFTPYIFGGLAVYHFNPYTKDAFNNYYHLRPLSTEGQGLPEYPDRQPYNLTQLAIPFGGGVKLALSDRFILSGELGLRKLFTDYLDDVSTTYVDPFILQLRRGTKALELSYRGDELPGGNPLYPSLDQPRGSPKSKDWYYFTTATLQYRLGAGNSRESRSRRRQVACPRGW